MKINKYINLMVLLLCFTSSCQTVKKVTFSSLETELTDFLIKNGDIHKFEIEEYKNGKRGLRIAGTQNNYNYTDGEIKNGIYSFSQTRTHAKGYFLIVENDSYTILDISSRRGLDEAIRVTLNFCERNKYCVDISIDYVSRLTNVYYSINKNPNARMDLKCEGGISETKNLP